MKSPASSEKGVREDEDHLYESNEGTEDADVPRWPYGSAGPDAGDPRRGENTAHQLCLGDTLRNSPPGESPVNLRVDIQTRLLHNVRLLPTTQKYYLPASTLLRWIGCERGWYTYGMRAIEDISVVFDLRL